MVLLPGVSPPAVQHSLKGVTLLCSACIAAYHAALPAGFFLFVGLTFYFCTHPPTPLAVTAEHVELLLHDLQQQLQQQLHSLHVGGNLQALGQGLSDRVHALEHSLQDRVHALEHRLQDGVHALEDRLSESFADNLHQLQVRSSDWGCVCLHTLTNCLFD
jgi:hypothetical protein